MAGNLGFDPSVSATPRITENASPELASKSLLPPASTLPSAFCRQGALSNTQRNSCIGLIFAEAINNSCFSCRILILEAAWQRERPLGRFRKHARPHAHEMTGLLLNMFCLWDRILRSSRRAEEEHSLGQQRFPPENQLASAMSGALRSADSPRSQVTPKIATSCHSLLGCCFLFGFLCGVPASFLLCYSGFLCSLFLGRI